LEEPGVPVDDDGPSEPAVDIGTTPPTELSSQVSIGTQPLDNHLELGVTMEGQSAARLAAVLGGGATGGVDHHRGPGAPGFGDHQ